MRAHMAPARAASRPQSRAAAVGKRTPSAKGVGAAFSASRAGAPLDACRAIARPSTSAPLAAAPSIRALAPAAAAAAARPATRKMTPLPPPRAVRADAPEAAAADASSQLLDAIAEITAVVDARVASALEASAAHAAQAAAEAAAGGKPASGDAASNAAAAALRARVEASVLRLQKGLLERETEVRLMLLAALCGEHLLLLGPPGTAKSELSRRLSGLLGGQQSSVGAGRGAGAGAAAGADAEGSGGCAYFERLLTRFSVPEELFGPLSMRGLENDQYVRQTAGYLPTAEVAFIDEIFKANSAILNALLTLLNERLFDNGSERLEAPLLTLVGASNELPESEELDALYDRFLLRRQVSQVSTASAAALARLAAGRGDAAAPGGGDGAGAGAAPAEQVVTVDDLRGTAGAARLAVDVPDAVIDVLVGLRTHLQERCEPPVYVSDRRFMKSVSLLQTAAHSDGRDRVSEYDCLLLEHALGSRPDDARKVRAHVLDTIGSDPGLQQAELVLLGLFGRACALLARPASAAAAAGSGEDAAEVSAAAEEAATLAALLEARHAELSASLDGGFPELRATLWQSAASARQAAQHLTPPLTENRKRAEDLLREARVLHACLEAPAPAGVLERMLPKRYKQFVKGIAGGAAAGAPAAR